MNEILPCGRCGSEHDVGLIYINDTPIMFCMDCRISILQKKKSVGRPSIGVTKKISLTLPKEEWSRLDKESKGNRSQFIREAICKALEEDTNEK